MHPATTLPEPAPKRKKRFIIIQRSQKATQDPTKKEERELGAELLGTRKRKSIEGKGESAYASTSSATLHSNIFVRVTGIDASARSTNASRGTFTMSSTAPSPINTFTSQQRSTSAYHGSPLFPQPVQPSSTTSTLNPEQLRILNDTTSNIFISASPGTGKTFVIIQKIVQLRNQIAAHGASSLVFASSQETIPLVVLTFSRKAKHEVRERLAQFDGTVSSLQAYVHTFHSFFLRLFKRWNFSINIISDAEVKKIVDTIVKEEHMDEPWSEMHSLYVKWKTAQVLPYGTVTRPQLTRTQERCILRIHAAMTGKHDLNDILLEAYRIMRDRPQDRPRIKYLLVDEFQDTSVTQMELIKLLNVQYQAIAVGDPKQCIFSWREARGEENINAFIQHFRAKTYALTCNYRSNEQIIHVANHIIPSRLQSTIPCTNEASTYIKRFPSVKRLRVVLMKEVSTYLKMGKTCAILCRTNFTLADVKFKIQDLDGFPQQDASQPSSSRKRKRSKYEDTSEDDDIKQSLHFLTLHNSKGKEFDVVFIVDANQGHIPHKKSIFAGDTAEEKRLFYVGVTRAKELLHLYGWNKDKMDRSLEPSEYVYKLIDSKCEFVHVDEGLKRFSQASPPVEESLNSETGDTFHDFVSLGGFCSAKDLLIRRT